MNQPMVTRPFRPRTRLAALFLGSLLFLVVGCGTSRAVRDAWPEPEFFGGLRTDVEDIARGGWGWFSTIDMPLSLVADIVLVPVHLTLWARQGLLAPEHDTTEFELQKTE